MSATIVTPLCERPPQAPGGCCAAPPPPPAAPILPTNAPGLSAISYRIGTFATFRREMLDAVANPHLLDPLANPFVLAGWHEGASGDYQTRFIELWAYLADVLTFYQERIANEAYIGTATQRDSLLRLVQLIDYVANPGSAASALAAFTIAKGKTLIVPPGFRIGNKPEGANPPAVYETSNGLTASDALNAIPLSAVAPTNQFAPLSSFSTVFNRTVIDPAALQSALLDLYPSAGLTFLPSMLFIAARLFEPIKIEEKVARSVVLQGTKNRLAAGDYVLAVEDEAPAGAPATNERTKLKQLTNVAIDETAKTTTITWFEDSNEPYKTDVNLYAFRVKAGTFGNIAPPWASLSPTLTGLHAGPFSPPIPSPPYSEEKWDDPGSKWFYVPIPNSSNTGANQVFLDATYNAVTGTPQQTTRAALLTDADGAQQVVHVNGARTISVNAYTLTAKVTRLTFGEEQKDEPIWPTTFPIRSTTVLCGSERLVLQNDLPLPKELSGTVLILAGEYPQLQAGQTVALQATRADTGATAAEAATISVAPAIDTVNGLTTVTLTKPLTNTYVRAGAVLMANVVATTQGQTVKDEILGSSDGSAYQAFALKKKPLTYVPATGGNAASTVASTLSVRVGGVEWVEAPTLLDATPDSQEYTTSTDDSGQTTIVFGDGVNGARPPTGNNNIHARYRWGMGAYGNVAAAKISQLLDTLTDVQKVTNPQPAFGGADPEPIAGIRVNAPNHVRSFGRAVSIEDYAALAKTYPGIEKASATWVRRDQHLVAIPNPYVQLTIATTDRIPLGQQPALAGNLRSFLDAHRDPNVPLRVVDFTPVYVDVSLVVDVLDLYGRQATINAVRAALAPAVNPDGSAGFFAFERFDFGESVPLSAVFAAAQNVAGVSDVNIVTFRRMDLDGADSQKTVVRNEVFIRPAEIAIVGNDPANLQHGFLTVTYGHGGYLDT